MEAIKNPNQNKVVSNNFVNAPSVYVGTYHKYNCGSIEGQWVNLIGHDKESFLALCRTIHSDEADPELMFQDYEGFPKEYYGECGLSDELWDWLNLSEDDRELMERYQDAIGDGGDIEDAREAFAGIASSEASFAETIAGEMDIRPADLPHWIVIDWESTWRCNLRYDYGTSKGADGMIWFFRQ